MNCPVCDYKNIDKLCPQCGFLTLVVNDPIDLERIAICKKVFVAQRGVGTENRELKMLIKKIEKSIENLNLSLGQLNDSIQLKDSIPIIQQAIDELEYKVDGLERYRQNKESIISNIMTTSFIDKEIRISFELPKVKLIPVDFELSSPPDLLFKISDNNSNYVRLIHSYKFKPSIKNGFYYHDFSNKVLKGTYTVKTIDQQTRKISPYKITGDFNGTFTV